MRMCYISISENNNNYKYHERNKMKKMKKHGVKVTLEFTVYDSDKWVCEGDSIEDCLKLDKLYSDDKNFGKRSAANVLNSIIEFMDSPDINLMRNGDCFRDFGLEIDSVKCKTKFIKEPLDI